MKRATTFLFMIGILILSLLAACRAEPPVMITGMPPTESPILSGRPDLPAEQSTRTPRPQEPIPSEATAVSGEAATPDPNGEPAESSGQDPLSSEGSWLWASITDPVAGTKNISTPRNYPIFIHENTISLITNCNFTSGTIAHDGSAISIVIDDSNLAECPLEEQQFVEKLNSAETYRMNNGRLQLNLAGSDITLELGAINDTIPQTWDDVLVNLQDPFHKTYCDAPAAILLVDKPTEPYLKAFGLASVEDNIAISPETPMEIGGNTNSFTNVIILQLQEEGLLSLDDPLSTWLPAIAAQIPNGEQITLRHLAQNTSGIPDYAESLILPAIENLDREAIQQSATPQDLVDIALANSPEEPPFAPGEDWQNSATNAILLGLIAEQVTERPLSALYQEKIFNPLGMTDSYLADAIPDPETVAQGYHTVDGGLNNFTDWNTSQGWASGGIVSTAEDMNKYIRGLFNGSLFQSVFTLSEMVNFVEADGTQYEKYGLGIGQFANTSFQAWGYQGQTPGFSSTWIYSAESDTVVVLLTNSGSCTSLDELPASLPPALFGLTSQLQEDLSEAEQTSPANFCALNALPYPRLEPIYENKRVQDLSAFAEALAALNPGRVTELDTLLTGKTILDLQALIIDGSLTSEELVLYYLNRIQTYDIGQLNSVLELNPEAITLAQALDAERATSGPRGPMHGIPVLLKDNIATADEMHTTAGSYALKDWQASQDAFLVAQLRDAGAIILGKANLSEWANWMDPCMPNGFSTVGGQTRNPYGAFDVSGSSSGSAAAVAANLTAVSVGTETQGSIILPASSNSVVGLKPSIGLVSRSNVIPLLPAQDVPGPMGRTVTDVAILLSAMTGVDANDPTTQDASALADTDFTQFLTADAAQGLRVGIIIVDEEAIQQTAETLTFSEEQIQSYREAVAPINEASRQISQLLVPFGIEIVEISSAKVPTNASPNGALEYGFKEALEQFLTDLGEEAPVGSLAEIIALNDEDLANRAPYGQGHLLDSQNTTMTADAFAAIVDGNRETAVSALTAIFQDSDIDVLISSTGQAYAPAGFPAITIPKGYDATGEPQGIVFVGDYLSEPQLLSVAYVFEQATRARTEPNLAATIQQIEALLPVPGE